MIPKSECKDRRLYRLNSRNLTHGVWCAKSGGFIGLRTKFDSTYPATEYHWEQGAPHGTAQPQEELSDELPAEIHLTERLDGLQRICVGPREASARYRLTARKEKCLACGNISTARDANVCTGMFVLTKSSRLGYTQCRPSTER